MKDSLRNLFTEMNSKHLTPIAIILVIAAIGVPVVMHKKNDSTPNQVVTNSADVGTTDAAPAGSDSTDQINVKDVNGATKGLDKHDPFVPKETVPKPGDGSGSGGSSNIADFNSAPNSSSAGGSTGSTGGGSASSGTGSQTTPSGTPVSSPESSTTQEPATKHLTPGSDIDHLERVVTLRFGEKDHEQELFRDITAVEPLPDSKTPVVSFIGISRHSDSAVFLLQQGVVQQGEGTCMPSPTDCQLIYLREDSEHNQHTFIVDLDHVYKLKLENISAVASDGRLSAKGALAPKKKKQ